MKPHLYFMLDALTHGVTFIIGKNGKLRIDSPDDVLNGREEMTLIRNHKSAITQQLIEGFDCVRDGLAVAEVRTLTVAAQRGQAVSLVRLVA